MSDPSLYLCVDCGGTKTSAVICDSTGQIVGRALGGPSNFAYIGLQPFLNVLQKTVQDALSSSATLPLSSVGLPSIRTFESVWIGVSGVDSPSAIHTLTEALSPIFGIPAGNKLQVTNDANLLASPLRMRVDLKSAVAVIAGTGSIVVTFSKGDGQESKAPGPGPAPIKEITRAGGWGWIIGDIGSGFEVGREALREVLTQADRLSVCGSPAITLEADPLSFQSRILSHFGVNTAPDLFRVVYMPDPPPTTVSDPTNTNPTSEPQPHPTSLLPRERRLSQLTPLVFQAAFEDCDEVALTVVKRCATSLAHQIASILVPTSETSSVPRNAVDASSSVLCFGGSLVGVAAYRDLILQELAALGHIFPVVEFVGGGDVAAAGAEALAAAGSS